VKPDELAPAHARGLLVIKRGRRRLLLIGVLIFAVSSAVSGAAISPAMMIVGRFGQGIAEAIAAPAPLGMIALPFTDPNERTKALGTWGGLFRDRRLRALRRADPPDAWRWLFFISLPVALVVLPRLVTESRMVREKHHTLDVAGAALMTLGLIRLSLAKIRGKAKA
jgi:MFS family permease